MLFTLYLHCQGDQSQSWYAEFHIQSYIHPVTPDTLTRDKWVYNYVTFKQNIIQLWVQRIESNQINIS